MVGNQFWIVELAGYTGADWSSVRWKLQDSISVHGWDMDAYILVRWIHWLQVLTLIPCEELCISESGAFAFDLKSENWIHVYVICSWRYVCSGELPFRTENGGSLDRCCGLLRLRELQHIDQAADIAT